MTIRVYTPGLSVEINILYILSGCLYCGDDDFHISGKYGRRRIIYYVRYCAGASVVYLLSVSRFTVMPILDTDRHGSIVKDGAHQINTLFFCQISRK